MSHPEWRTGPLPTPIPGGRCVAAFTAKDGNACVWMLAANKALDGWHDETYGFDFPPHWAAVVDGWFTIPPWRGTPSANGLQYLKVVDFNMDFFVHSGTEAEIEAVFSPLVGHPIYKADLPKSLICGIACFEAGVWIQFKLLLLKTAKAQTPIAGRTLREWWEACQPFADGPGPC